MKIDIIRLICILVGMAIVLIIEYYMLVKAIPIAGYTKKIRVLADGSMFSVNKKQLCCVHFQIWIPMIWLISTIVVLESRTVGIFQVLSDWKWLFLFIICFFIIINVILYFVLVRYYVFISKEKIDYRFDFRTHSLPIKQIESISKKQDNYQIVMKTDRVVNIPHSGLYFLEDSNKAHRLLDELSDYIKQIGTANQL